MDKTGQNRYCHITHSGSHYTFHDLRDFHRTRDDKKQEQNWIIDTFDVEKLDSLDMIIVPFARHNLVAHTILTFHFSDGKKVSLSVEAQLKDGKDYSFWKAVFLGYHNLYIRGTEKDHLGLRSIRKEHPVRYPLHLAPAQLQKLFAELVAKTNEVSRTHERYALLWNNCTSALRSSARHYFPLPRRHRTLIFAPWLPYFLKKKGALKLTEKKTY